VNLIIFDSLGRELTKLVSEEMLPGIYSKIWNAEGLSSETYFACLDVGSFTESKKLVFLK
jgi:hypothetical protein